MNNNLTFRLTCEPKRYQHDHAESNVDKLGQDYLILCVLGSFSKLFLVLTFPLVFIPVFVWKRTIDVLHYMQEFVVAVLILFEFLRGEYFHKQNGKGMEDRYNHEAYKCPFQCKASVKCVRWRGWFSGVFIIIPSIKLRPANCLIKIEKMNLVCFVDQVELSSDAEGVQLGQPVVEEVVQPQAGNKEANHG